MSTTNEIDSPQAHELDALIVGAGFAGVYQLKVLRDAGYKVKLVDAATDFGGVWYWNRYPGARVDSDIPHYEFSDPELWKDWTWQQRFPGGPEILSYFAHVAEKWDLRKDTQFNTFVSAATWDEVAARWTVKTETDETYRVKFLLLNIGFAAKKYIPDWPGKDSFKGTFIHPSNWPHQDPDLKGKNVAIIGTGATGIQIAQEVSKTASQLTIFQRTPNMPLPMGQQTYTPPTQALPKSAYPSLFANRNSSFSGFSHNFLPRNTFDDTPAQRAALYEDLWSHGDFHFWLATYQDMLYKPDANASAYTFWFTKTRSRIHDPRIADIVAPKQQPYAFGCKRVALEQGFFEIFNEPHVDIVDVSNKESATPIVDITPTGLKTTKKDYDFDTIICATGFDALTGGLRQIALTNSKGETLAQHWNAPHGTKTYLGMSVSGFPNLFFTYGPQAPTAFCNGPTCAELQGGWIKGVMGLMRERGLRRVEARAEREEEWTEGVWKVAGASLLTGVDSWYMGANIPGKMREPLVYMGGVPTYYKKLTEEAEGGYPGFELS